MYSGYELLWLIFVYSFFGWIIETVVGSIKKRRFVNRGFLSGPVCLVYGISAVIMTVALRDLSHTWEYLFLGCTLDATAIEWITGKLLERMTHHKWWDYSGKRWNFDGYICLQSSLFWGVLGVCAIKFFNRALITVYRLIPDVVAVCLIWILVVILIFDLTATIAAILRIQKKTSPVYRWERKLAVMTRRFGRWIVAHVERRIVRAYPVIGEKPERPVKEGKFAEGCGFYKLFWLFVIGSLIGDLAETVFCRITMGWWMSRSSLVWGPFSIVWGLALVIATLLLYKDRDKPEGHIFLVGTLLGGAYEYICSVVLELVFGKVFWDYSGLPFNLNGRVNLLYCFFWGIAAVIWIRWIYPRFSDWIEKIPMEPGKIITWILVVFMAANMLVSSMALIRYDSRAKGKEAAAQWEVLMDEYYDDSVMSRIYPKAKEP